VDTVEQWNNTRKNSDESKRLRIKDEQKLPAVFLPAVGHAWRDYLKRLVSGVQLHLVLDSLTVRLTHCTKEQHPCFTLDAFFFL
jgi:hypothetical protein